ncbi:MAG TPA: radical SAM protein [Chitinivibrionales bacterium]|nr:radical SAM protein [Chitinivibrionales bacterium]
MPAPVVREILCKTILSKSGLSDYSLNCYGGCGHGCVYCYARYMEKFRPHPEKWGGFVDVKNNAAAVLAREVKKKRPGEVFVSSVCDGWQPVEAKYELTRECVKILLENGFTIDVLTKNALIERDFDIFSAHKNRVDVGMTLTTLDEGLARRIEPGASSPARRIAALKKAAGLGIKTHVFFGPLMPFLSDRPSDLEAMFAELGRLGPHRIYLDKLNIRYGVWDSLCVFLRSFDPALIEKYRKILFDPEVSARYADELARRSRALAARSAMESALTLCF